MPGDEDGFALAKWIRRHHPDTKVLLTSGFPHPSEKTRHLDEPLIPKPYVYSSVLQRIQNLFLAGQENRLRPVGPARDLPLLAGAA